MLKAIEEMLLTRFEADTQSSWVEDSYQIEEAEAIARVRLQRNRQSQPMFRYWLGEHRVSRDVLATLSCTVQRCPQHQAMMQKWRDHHTGSIARRPRAEPFGVPRVLAREEVFDTPTGRVFAREARFPYTVVCPEGVHDPLNVTLTGWDLFDDHDYLYGGMEAGTPMFENLSQVQAWIDMRASHRDQSCAPA